MLRRWLDRNAGAEGVGEPRRAPRLFHAPGGLERRRRRRPLRAL